MISARARTTWTSRCRSASESTRSSMNDLPRSGRSPSTSPAAYRASSPQRTGRQTTSAPFIGRLLCRQPCTGTDATQISISEEGIT